MLSKYRQKRQEGFTIIEVLIVLAIAGLILLVVFLAVPALQRNARNTQRSNDMAGVLGGMSEYVNNNNGQLPDSTGSTDNNTTLILQDSNTTSENTVEVNLGYYSADAITIDDAAGTPSEESAIIVIGAECNGTAVTTSEAPSRGYAAQYVLETDSQQCRES